MKPSVTPPIKSTFYLVLLLLYGLTGTAYAEIYKWVDENGKVHFSDKEVPQAEQIKLSDPSVETDNNAEVERINENIERLNKQAETERQARQRELQRVRDQRNAEFARYERECKSASGSLENAKRQHELAIERGSRNSRDYYSGRIDHYQAKVNEYCDKKRVIYTR